MGTLRVLLADDHSIVREGLRALIQSSGDMEIVAEAASGREAVELAATTRPDIAVVDISMPELNGIMVTERIRVVSPTTRVLVLTVHEDRSYVRQLLKAGALGYVLKRSATTELLRAIRIVTDAGVYVDPSIGGRDQLTALRRDESSPGAGNKDLSAREIEVAQLLARGHTNKDIATRLGIGVKTIETYKNRLMEKLHFTTRAELVRFGHEQGWFEDA